MLVHKCFNCTHWKHGVSIAPVAADESGTPMRNVISTVWPGVSIPDSGEMPIHGGMLGPDVSVASIPGGAVSFHCAGTCISTIFYLRQDKIKH